MSIRVKSFKTLRTAIIEIDTRASNGVVVRNFIDVYEDEPVVDTVTWIIVDGKIAAITNSYIAVKNKLKTFN